MVTLNSFEMKISISFLFFAPKKHAPPFLKILAERFGEHSKAFWSFMFILHDMRWYILIEKVCKVLTFLSKFVKTMG